MGQLLAHKTGRRAWGAESHWRIAEADVHLLPDVAERARIKLGRGIDNSAAPLETAAAFQTDAPPASRGDVDRAKAGVTRHAPGPASAGGNVMLLRYRARWLRLPFPGLPPRVQLVALRQAAAYDRRCAQVNQQIGAVVE
ncbi:MAG TPA: hypothetical protein VHB98_04320 [Chloroflexota bacterium]|nr:hypothetical protein [Chloroflexota bacterium]